MTYLFVREVLIYGFFAREVAKDAKKNIEYSDRKKLREFRIFA